MRVSLMKVHTSEFIVKNIFLEGSANEVIDILKPLHILSLVFVLGIMFNKKSNILINTKSFQIFEEPSLESLKSCKLSSQKETNLVQNCEISTVSSSSFKLSTLFMVFNVINNTHKVDVDLR